ncbi:MAG: hypothetical protein AB1486_09380 [Planctomycetota bacterium]
MRDDPKRRFRYLVRLFAKEVVLRNFADAGAAAILEKLVEVLTHIDGSGTRTRPAVSGGARRGGIHPTRKRPDAPPDGAAPDEG